MQILLLSLIFLFQSPAADTADVSSSVESATVFLSGAEVHRQVDIELQRGTNYIRFSGLSSSLREETIQLHSDSDIILESISKSTDQNAGSTKIENLQSRKEAIQDSIKQVEASLRVLDRKLNVLQTNQDLSGDNTKISAGEIKQAMVYFSQQFEEIERQRIELNDKLEQLKKRLDEINREINKIRNQQRRSSGVIEIAVNSDTPQQTTFNLSYFVPGARWYPSYDARVDGIDSPLNLRYKANIAQNTGVDWNNVNLTISSAEPRSSSTLPSIDPVYLEFFAPQRRANDVRAEASFKVQNLRTAGEAGITRVSGIVRDAETGEPLPAVNIYSPETEVGTSTNTDGRYSLRVPANAKTLRITYIGYSTKTVPIYSSSIDVNLKASSQHLNEVVVTGYSAGSPSTELQEGQTAFSFEIDNPYTIKSGAPEKTVAVEDYTLTAEYEYFTIPKKQQKAFLTAGVTDWESLNLLTGNVNLFLEDSYVGETTIDLDTAQDTLSFSLGEDDGIVVERSQIESFREKNFFGGKVTETKGWENVVRNTKSTPVTINVLDQIPVSSNEDIDVELTERSGASFDESTGQLKWNITLEPGEPQNLRFVYEITYPSDKQLQESRR